MGDIFHYGANMWYCQQKQDSLYITGAVLFMLTCPRECWATIHTCCHCHWPSAVLTEYSICLMRWWQTELSICDNQINCLFHLLCFSIPFMKKTNQIMNPWILCHTLTRMADSYRTRMHLAQEQTLICIAMCLCWKKRPFFSSEVCAGFICAGDSSQKVQWFKCCYSLSLQHKEPRIVHRTEYTELWVIRKMEDYASHRTQRRLETRFIWCDRILEKSNNRKG